MSHPFQNQQGFCSLPATSIYDLVYPKQLSISLLLNGTRRWYIAEYLDAPPTDHNYFHDYMEKVLIELKKLISQLTSHGLYRIFMPVYSWYQPARNPVAHHYLLKGIESLITHPLLVDVYREKNIQVRFYGDMSHFPAELQELIQSLTAPKDNPSHYLYFGVDGGNPYNHTLQLAHEFSNRHNKAPEWGDILELYYGDRTLTRLHILVAFNRLYSRGGIPHLLEGGDRIYASVVTPLVLSEASLRLILFDFLYNRQNHSRDYRDIHPRELARLKEFYATNTDTVIGLLKKYEDLVYPLPTIHWPNQMDN